MNPVGRDLNKDQLLLETSRRKAKQNLLIFLKYIQVLVKLLRKLENEQAFKTHSYNDSR